MNRLIMGYHHSLWDLEKLLINVHIHTVPPTTPSPTIRWFFGVPFCVFLCGGPLFSSCFQWGHTLSTTYTRQSADASSAGTSSTSWWYYIPGTHYWPAYSMWCICHLSFVHPALLLSLLLQVGRSHTTPHSFLTLHRKNRGQDGQEPGGNRGKLLNKDCLPSPGWSTPVWCPWEE